MRFTVVAVLLSVPLSVAPYAQRAEPLAFEVSSVRLSQATGSAVTQRILDNRVDLGNITLRSLMRLAFGVRDYELSAPDWLAEVRVNVQATLPANSTRRQIPQMLQRLLFDRFGLTVRRENRPMQVYELVVGATGTKMREVEPVNAVEKEFKRDPGLTSPAAIALADTSVDTLDGTVRTVMGDLGRTVGTATTMYKLRLNFPQRTQTLDATRMTMAELAGVLTDNMDQPVIDRTGLSGGYQFTLELPIAARSLQELRRASPTFEYLPGVSESSAVEGIGLKMERRTAPIEVLVVDKMSRTPTEN
jgi:uncharacterized protein (TIGR03435 family)